MMDKNKGSFKSLLEKKLKTQESSTAQRPSTQIHSQSNHTSVHNSANPMWNQETLITNLFNKNIHFYFEPQSRTHKKYKKNQEIPHIESLDTEEFYQKNQESTSKNSNNSKGKPPPQQESLSSTIPLTLDQKKALDFFKLNGHPLPWPFSLQELQRAFRKTALQLHPDRGGCSKKFQELRSAFEELQITLRPPSSQGLNI